MVCPITLESAHTCTGLLKLKRLCFEASRLFTRHKERASMQIRVEPSQSLCTGYMHFGMYSALSLMHGLLPFVNTCTCILIIACILCNAYTVRSIPGKRPLPGKSPCTSFQGVNVADTIQMYENHIPGKRPCRPKLRCMFKRLWALTRDTTVVVRP